MPTTLKTPEERIRAAYDYSKEAAVEKFNACKEEAQQEQKKRAAQLKWLLAEDERRDVMTWLV
jgi:hypothetical protein